MTQENKYSPYYYDGNDPLKIQHGGDHYKNKRFQPIEFIMGNNLGFAEGCIVKYADRHELKGGAEDVHKIIHYAQFILKYKYGEDLT